MHRREFLAWSTASAAATTVLGMPTVSGISRTIQFAKPELVELHSHNHHKSCAVVSRPSLLETAASPITESVIELSPLACTQARIADNAGIDIELRHPGCGKDSILYSAHKIGLGAYPAGVMSPVQADTTGALTLLIKQRHNDRRQLHQIRLNANRAGSYLLAIPTEPGAHAPIWCSSTIELNCTRTPTQIQTLFETRIRSCMFMHVRVFGSNAQNEGAIYAG